MQSPVNACILHFFAFFKDSYYTLPCSLSDKDTILHILNFLPCNKQNGNVKSFIFYIENIFERFIKYDPQKINEKHHKLSEY